MADIEECCVCLEAMNQQDNPSIHLDCDHELHADCMAQWLQTDFDSTCPLCRSQVFEDAPEEFEDEEDAPEDVEGAEEVGVFEDALEEFEDAPEDVEGAEEVEVPPAVGMRRIFRLFFPGFFRG